jgi:hypothetical protein
MGKIVVINNVTPASLRLVAHSRTGTGVMIARQRTAS